MIVLQILILGVLLLVVPTWVGMIFSGVDKNIKKLLLRWISGQLLLWAGFQVICVPLVLMEREKGFTELVFLFSAFILLMLVIATIYFFQQKNKGDLRVLKKEQGENKRLHTILWAVFWCLLVFQMMQAVTMTYADGDDAFYVAVSSITEDAENMYQKLPYTGRATELDVRHGLAPFPVWIAFLARISGVISVSVAHIAVPLTLIPMTYAIYYLIGSRLFHKKAEAVPVFLIFTELLVLFGDYSFYTVENFMIARSRQGKAALGSIIIPMLFFLLLMLLEKVQEQQKIPLSFWLLLAVTMTAGCLCSTMGALLVCMLMGITGLCAAFCYKKWKLLFPMAACCIPCVMYAALYLVLG